MAKEKFISFERLEELRREIEQETDYTIIVHATYEDVNYFLSAHRKDYYKCSDKIFISDEAQKKLKKDLVENNLEEYTWKLQRNLDEINDGLFEKYLNVFREFVQEEGLDVY